MKFRILFLALFLLILAAACRKSEVDQGPAAQVSETSATSATDTSITTASTTAATSTEPTPGAPVGKVIKEKSKIEFVGAKVTRDHDGKFNNFDGWIEYAAAKPSRIAFDIDLNSIETDDEKLTGHLKTPDFFDVAQYPKATFVSTSLTEGAGTGAPAGSTHTLTGNLTMHGVTKEVSFPVKAETTAEGVRATSDFSINRHDWGISYKGMADDLIKDNVLIKLDLLFPPPPAA
jgi:polyisoprenoid-binding protein YceI